MAKQALKNKVIAIFHSVNAEDFGEPYMHSVARKSSYALSSFFLLTLLLVSASGRAQLTESTLKGSVADASGSVQHAAILVINEGTGISRSVTGSDDGLLSAVVSLQSGRPFSPFCSSPFSTGALLDHGCDYNMDGGGGIASGYYDRPDAPAPGAVKSKFKQADFINRLYSPTVFPQPVLGTDGTLRRDVYRGPRQTSTDLALGRNFHFRENETLQFRADAYNAFNNVNLFLPNDDLALVLKPDGTYSSTSAFGKSTQAFDPRVLQLSAKIIF
jgi:hypothetical protein